jgi:hypothetical protein
VFLIVGAGLQKARFQAKKGRYPAVRTPWLWIVLQEKKHWRVG